MWRHGEQPAPESRWLLSTKLPKPGNTSDRLLPERRGQLLLLMLQQLLLMLQQAANLCNPQTCSSLLMVQLSWPTSAALSRAAGCHCFCPRCCHSAEDSCC